MVPPARPAEVSRLQKRMSPPCFSTMPRPTHRPRPVPVSFLVEKKGSKR